MDNDWQFTRDINLKTRQGAEGRIVITAFGPVRRLGFPSGEDLRST